MFTPGQLLFAGIFFIAFVAVIIFAYRKDLQLHRKYYKGSLYILGGFLLFILLLFALKMFLKN